MQSAETTDPTHETTAVETATANADAASSVTATAPAGWSGTEGALAAILTLCAALALTQLVGLLQRV